MFPAPHTVETHAAIDGARNAKGNTSRTWADGVPQKVYGWSSAAESEPSEVGRNAVIRDVDLLVPPGFVVGPHDRVTLAGDLYEVVGHPQDFNHGPFGFQPGGVVNLRRVEG